MSERQTLQTKYNKTRSNLLLVVAFTVINVILLVVKAESYFLFSAYIPYAIVEIGMLVCGMFSGDYFGVDVSEYQIFNRSVFSVFLVIALVIVALYLISWIFSKNKVGWIIFALVIFSLDTVGMLVFAGIDIANIVDVIFHGWIIVSLSIGITAHFKLKKLPPEEQPEAEQVEQPSAIPQYSQVLRIADVDVKSRTLLEGDVFGHSVVYRRVKKTNELVVDGNVYGEYIATIEIPHSLKATIDGHEVEVGFDGTFSYLKVDGSLDAKKLRLF